MKKISISLTLIISLFCISSISAFANTKKLTAHSYSNPGDTLSFKKDVVDLSNIPQGKPVTIEFEYTNNSTNPLIIADVHTSCGCTVASFDKAPVLPGKSGKITATYNAANQGSFTKAITVVLSGQQQKVLTIRGKVV